jgi:ABC-2 type transport system permease protein
VNSRLTSLYGWLALTSARRRDLIWGALFSSMLISIITATLGFLWIAALPDGQSIEGYDAISMVWYIAFAEAAVNGVDQRLMVRLGDDLRRGDMTIELLRPVTLVWMVMSREIGRSIARFALSLPACCAVAWVLVGPPPSWVGLATLAVTGPLAVLVQMLLVLGATSSALWIGDTTAAWFVLQKLVFLAGGMLLPLEFWPGIWGDVLTVLPWASTAYIPAHLAVDPSGGRVLELVGLQVAWIVVLLFATAAAWARGERRLMTVGG